MPAKKIKNPLTLERLQSTVINYIILEVFVFTLIATAVALINQGNHDLSVEPQMLTVLGTIIGLVISFRTSSAYDRYWEGRKLWSVFHAVSRNIAEIIWIHVPLEKKKIPEDSKPAPPPEWTATIPTTLKAEPAVFSRPGEDSDRGSMLTLTEDTPYLPTSVKEELTVDEEERRIERLKAIIEKKTMINIVEALGPALKHFLRDEPGIRYDDLYPLLSGLPHFASTDAIYHTDEDVSPLLHYDLWEIRHPEEANWRPKPPVEKAKADWKRKLTQRARHAAGRTPAAPEHGDLEKGLMSEGGVDLTMYFDDRHVGLKDSNLKPARIPPRFQVYEHHQVLAYFRFLAQRLARLCTIIKCKLKGEPVPDLPTFLKEDPKPKDNIPLELCLFLHSYYAVLMDREFLAPSICSGFYAALANLQECVLSLERIKSTPLPFAYQAHLQLATWLYLAALPLQLYKALGWVTIPATAVASFMFLGFLQIGQEIEDPFNYDANDLKLDKFCKNISRELAQIVAHPNMDPRTFVYSRWNRPFDPKDLQSLSAEAILQAQDFRGANYEHRVRSTHLKSLRNLETEGDKKFTEKQKRFANYDS
ncbi:hypothetical protein BOTBODRAFT_191914 [Botryobasidium botryosum FD-172 SS1]|uniref:Uncharacterized protein n=1 Tax=Botryobasidium botryosum (strain FD-172 SS1) TaxID=930990 RepID=A0A067M8D9_BOTB1|nr:hypothetical protein BOTBODRAFT_191914 [Botryobasidium botryosum FD-172 SS1]